MTTLPLAEVRNKFSSLVEDVARTHDTLTITRNGVPAVVMLSSEEYESILETLALTNDPAAQERLKEAEQSITDGDVTSRDDMAAIMAARRSGALR